MIDALFELQSDQEYEAALNDVNYFMDLDRDLAPDEIATLDRLADLIQAYEAKRFPL